MADAFIGTWKGDASSYTGMKEFLEAYASSAEFDRYTKKFTLVVTKEGHNKYKLINSVEGHPDVIQNMVIGGKCKENHPGLAEFELEYQQEGDKIKGIGSINGAEMVGYRYVEGNQLVLEFTIGGYKATQRATRA